MRRGLIAFAMTATCALAAPARAQSRGIITEAVNIYGPKDSLFNSIANADGFRQGMTQPGSSWFEQTRYVDSEVFDTDFIDPELFGAGNGDDTHNFDQTGAGIAFFSGHGSNQDGTNQMCLFNSDCRSPPQGAGLPAVCVAIPNQVFRTCHYTLPRFLITNSPGDKYNGAVQLSRAGGVAWGESTSSGAWDKAGTNGGINLAVVDISFGLIPSTWSVIQSAFAGVHLWATIMPTAGDVANVADRGSKFAAFFQANSNTTVADSWAYTLNSLGSEGGNCGSSDGSTGGGGGINGCGCNVIVSVDADVQHAAAKIDSESWNQLPFDTFDARGDSAMSFEWLCNYDAVKYGWSN
jgi:hypothetical protein